MTIEELMKNFGLFLELYTTNPVFRHNLDILSKVPLENIGKEIE